MAFLANRSSAKGVIEEAVMLSFLQPRQSRSHFESK